MNLLMRVAAIAMMLHITPAVVLVKRPDAVEALLPGAETRGLPRRRRGDSEPGRESRRVHRRRGGQGGGPRSCGVPGVVQSCEGVTAASRFATAAQQLWVEARLHEHETQALRFG